MCTLFGIACLAYAFVVINFALLYLLVDIHYPCMLNIYKRGHWGASFLGACYFSLETVLTIGYGTTDEFFGGCTSPLVLIFFQAMISIVIDSCLFGVLFAKFSRGQPRALSVAVSRNCIVRNIRGHWYLMFRVCETRTEQLCEAHVRIYAVRSSSFEIKHTISKHTTHDRSATNEMRTAHSMNAIRFPCVHSFPMMNSVRIF